MPKLLELTGSLNDYSYTTFPDLSNFSSPAQPQIVSQKHFNTRWEKSPLSSRGGKTHRRLNTLIPSTALVAQKNPLLHRPRQRHHARIE